jgi:hypothetical protein
MTTRLCSFCGTILHGLATVVWTSDAIMVTPIGRFLRLQRLSLLHEAFETQAAY